MIKHQHNVFDIAIIGQGIAGTLLSYELIKQGKKVLVIDNGHKHSASKIAAGIVNPITGKNYVKSWRIDEFLPVARETYAELSQFLGISTYTDVNILRSIDDVESENNWLSRTADPSISKFTLSKANSSEIEGKIRPKFSFGELTGTFQVHLPQIVSAYRTYLESIDAYLEEEFDYKELIEDEEGYHYSNHTFSQIVFCEGYKGSENIYFTKVGFAPAKGEVLIVKIPGLQMTKIYKEKMFLIPLGDEIYWVGSGYEWDSIDELPSEGGRLKIKAMLDELLLVPFTVLDHLAAIRPTIYDRRPIIIQHPEKKGMYLFNGLGTKGASIAPFVSKQLVRHLIDKDPADLLF